MEALIPGTVAPDFKLAKVGGGEFSLTDALKQGPVVAVFFKISCPVCQFALPYVQRLYESMRGKGATIVAVSQNDENLTKLFMREYKLSVPVLLDDPGSYRVSNAYGLTNVPTLFYISRDGEIEQTMVGWDRSEMDQVSARLAGGNGAPVPLFQPGEDVPEFKAG